MGGLDLRGGVGLRDKEGERLRGRLLGEREREASEGVTDLARLSPNLGALRSLSLLYRRRGGVLDLHGL